MSIGIFRGLLTIVLFSSFVALWIWAWNSKRKHDFDAAAHVPLEDDEYHPHPSRES